MFKTNYLTEFNNDHNDWIEEWLKGAIDSARLRQHFKWVDEVVESHRTYHQQSKII